MEDVLARSQGGPGRLSACLTPRDLWAALSSRGLLPRPWTKGRMGRRPGGGLRGAPNTCGLSQRPALQGPPVTPQSPSSSGINRADWSLIALPPPLPGRGAFESPCGPQRSSHTSLHNHAFERPRGGGGTKASGKQRATELRGSFSKYRCTPRLCAPLPFSACSP